MLLPVDFPYWLFALLIFGNGVGSGLFASPNTSAIMSSRAGQAARLRVRHAVHVPELRHVPVHRHLLLADDRRAGLERCRTTLTSGLTAQGVPASVATQVGHLPPVSTMFAALLGYNPVQNLLAPYGVLAKLPAHNVAVLTGRQFFPDLISAPFHHGLVIVFTAAAIMSVDRRAGLAAARQAVLLRRQGTVRPAVTETISPNGLGPSSPTGDSPAGADGARPVLAGRLPPRPGAIALLRPGARSA